MHIICKASVVLLSAVLAFSTMQLRAEDTVKFPEKTITVLCTHATGGDTDYNAQLLSFFLSDRMRVAVEVKSVPGNNGVIALNQLKDADADGYTLLATNTSALCAAEATGISGLSYQDFAPVAIYGRQCGENILVSASSPYKTLDDLLAAAKRRPNRLKIGVSMGSTSFISSVIFDKEKGATFKMVDVGGDAEGRLGSLLNNYTDVTIVPYALARESISEGKLRSLATLMSDRLSAAPDIPTVKECGVPDLTIDTLYVVLAPKNTPPELIEIINTHIREVALNNEDYKAAVADYNQQAPYALPVKETTEILKKQRDHIMSYAKYLN